MKFVCLLHESELQITELTEYKGTDTSVRHIVNLITHIHTYIRYKVCKSVTKAYLL